MKDIFNSIENQIDQIDAKIEKIVGDINKNSGSTYETFNKKINNVMNQSAKVFDESIQQAEIAIEKAVKKTGFQFQQENLKKYQTQTMQKNTTPTKIDSKSKFRFYANKEGYFGGGLALSIVFYIFTLFIGIAMFVLAILGSVIRGFSPSEILILLLGIGAVFFLIGRLGQKMTKRVRRFKKYIQLIGEKLYVEIEEIAYACNKSVNFTTRDVKLMISDGWFKEGRVTHDQKTLIVSNDVYGEYLQQEQKQARREELLKQRETLPNEAQEIIKKASSLISLMHDTTNDIQDIHMRDKIKQLELILTKIIKKVETKPEVVSQLRRLFDYYLPTTVKLIETYAFLNGQTVEGTNILNTKSEIEGSLDTLIAAYLKLYDDLFVEVMLDVSTDISVLNNMLAQDGLTKSSLRGE